MGREEWVTLCDITAFHCTNRIEETLQNKQLFISLAKQQSGGLGGGAKSGRRYRFLLVLIRIWKPENLQPSEGNKFTMAG